MKYDELEEQKLKEGIDIILYKLGNLDNNEKLCIVSDNETSELGELFYSYSLSHNTNSQHFVINELKMHAEEPPKHVSEAMKSSDLIIGLTKLSMAHTRARHIAASYGTRYLSLPDYSKEILKHPALRINFHEQGKKTEILARQFSNSNKIKLITEHGTDLELDISQRNGNFAPGYVNEKILLGSPPDIEANVSPIESHSNGKVIIDGSIPYPGIGQLKNPITLELKSGKISSMYGDDVVCGKLENLFEIYGENSRILAECGVGFNKKANLCGNMLMDEGAYGTIHLGFGSNIILGGSNEINFHLDFVFYANNLILDGASIKI